MDESEFKIARIRAEFRERVHAMFETIHLRRMKQIILPFSYLFLERVPREQSALVIFE